jgi:co-chaperonin GroES (HSP10)
MDETLQATGWFVLIELLEVSQTTASGIVLSSNYEHDREQQGHHRGKVINFGPQAFSGYRGIDDADDVTERAAKWGIEVGDIAEVGRYAGFRVNPDDPKDLRMMIPDQKIMGVVNNET